MQCMYIKHDGSECHANAMAGSEYCWFHAPEVDYSRSDARSKGGKAYKTGIYSELPVINLKTVNDIPELLMDTIRQLRHGFIGPRIAATIGYLAAGLTRSFEAGEMSKRISRHEKLTRDGLTMLNEKLEKLEEKLPPH